MHILCGDIGGTKTRLAIFDLGDKFLNPVAEETYSSQKYASLSKIATEFINNFGIPISNAVFGVAGPVLELSCNTTNLPWRIDAQQMEHELGISTIHLMNDLEATAWGIAALDNDDFSTLQKGSESSNGNRAIIAAGTGLGQAGMFWDGKKHIPFASEGGHCDFAPGNELEYALLAYLQHNKRRVCWEDILSGPGLTTIYSFLLKYNHTPQPKWFRDKLEKGDSAAIISDLAKDRRDPLCAEALELFIHLYGAEAGNQALKLMATGGVYIGGGIAPKIFEWLKQPAFIEAFCNKGKMRELMESIPVRVILNDRAALYGPAIYFRTKLLGP